MFEAHVLHLLQRYLGQYVRGLSLEALKISVWQGDVVLKDLQLKAEALNALKLPITVKAGFLGSIRLKVPWNRLGKEPVVVLLDRIFILAEPVVDDVYNGEGVEEKKQEAKRRRIEEAELAMLEAKDKKTASVPSEGGSWIGSLLATVVGNLKLSITNVHIRYEDAVSNLGHPFCAGITLAKLAAVTTDDNGVETFVASGALDRLRKAVELERLAVYHDPHSVPWKVPKKWEGMAPAEWSEIFEPGISESPVESRPRLGLAEALPRVDWGAGRQYLLQPTGGKLRYLRQGKKDKRQPHEPFQRAVVVLDEVALTISEAQYCDVVKMIERVSEYRNRSQYAALRPRAAVKDDPRAWWLFAYKGLMQSWTSLKRPMSWPTVQSCCEKRRRYISLYSSSLQSGAAAGSKVQNEEIWALDAQLEPEVIIVWRLLAHAQVETEKQREAAAERERLRNSHWWSFGWGSGGATDDTQSEDTAEASTPKGFTAAEWAKINELLDFHQGAEVAAEEGSAVDGPNQIATAVDVTMRRNAAKLVGEQGAQILEGAFEGLKVGMRFFQKTVEMHVKLDSYGLSAPEGTLVKSVRQEGRDGALTARFVHAPLGEPALDWCLTAGVAPCQVTLWKASLDRCAAWVQAGHAISPAVSLETAAALESTLEAVRKSARERVAAVLEKRLRFALDLDIDAPKVAIPVPAKDGSPTPRTQLILDFGHFTLRTDPEENPQDLTEEEMALYSRFRVRASDISAWLVDGEYDWAQDKLEASSPRGEGSAADERLLLPVLDKCGLAAAIHQIHMTHVHHPSTRIAARVPTLGFHFSPARYDRLMSVLYTLYPVEDPQDRLLQGAPQLAFSKKDHAGKVQVLTWTGIGKTLAQWQPRYAVHAGMYLYVLEGEGSRTYLRYSSLMGKQVVNVPAAAIGGWEHVIAICDRGADLSKVAESIHSLVLRFESADALAGWTASLTQAIYRASAPLAVTAMEDSPSQAEDEEEADEPINTATVKSVYFVGVLEELTVSLNGRASIASHTVLDRWQETTLLKLRALGSKVELVKRLFDLSIGVGLHSLEIEDVLFGHNGPHCKYIARSLLLTEPSRDSPSLPSLPSLPIKLPERRIIREDTPAHDSDDDGFADALEDFAGSPDSMVSRRSGFHSPSFHDPVYEDEPQSMLHDGVPSFTHSGGLLPQAVETGPGTQVEADFVTMQIVTLQPDSPDYDRVDTQLAIQVATLEFFCNRPTVVALTEFGGDVSTIQAQLSAAQLAAQVVGVGQVVYGLEGRGKVRTIFQLLLDMDTARIYLNLEDGDQLAVLAEERIHVDLKVFPSSMRIVASLGNLRIADLMLPAAHRYSWACDMRDPGSSSLVELHFESYSPGDDDYAGYEYSLRGKLQAVRLIFLYRFVQELMDYFLALATPDTGKVVQIVEDAGVERLVKQSELNGAMALKLDISADAPIIKMPKTSDSDEFMQLDLGHLQLSNRFEWRGGDTEEPSAVRLDIMQIQGQDLQFLVGIDGKAGQPMFEEVQGVTVTVKRPLRDLFKRLPEVETDVKIQRLRAVMSDKEYHVIIACAASNIAEPKHVFPTFRHDLPAAADSAQALASVTAVVDASEGPASPTEDGMLEQGVAEAEAQPPWTTNRVAVEVEHAELELFMGLERDASLASLVIRDLWQVYCSSSAGEQQVLLTLPRFTVVDNRPSTKSEMRFTVGSAIDVDHRGLPVGEASEVNAQAAAMVDSPQPGLTMLVLDYKATQAGRSLVLRTQKPRLLVSLDFLLAVTDFFVPTFHAAGGSGQSAADDPIGMQGNLRLETPLFVQQADTAWLSPEQQLEVDAAHVDEFVYDGRGGALCLLEEAGGQVVAGVPPAPLILIGNGKHLRFKNVRLRGGVHLDACVHLGLDSSYSAAAEDGCKVEDAAHDTVQALRATDAQASSGGKLPGASVGAVMSGAALGLRLDVQAVGVELTFYDTTKWPVGSVLRPEKLLRARLDCSCQLRAQGEEARTQAVLKGMRVEGGSGLTVVDPFDVSLDYSCAAGKQDVSVALTAISVRVTGNVLRLLQRLQADLVTTFHLGGVQVAARCTQFDRVWLNETGCSPAQQVAFWRPRVPPGYAVTGDCATSGAAPPSQSVIALSMAYERVKRPVAYELVWSSYGMLADDGAGCEPSGGSRPTSPASALVRECRLWLPVAPPGYVAIGCVAWRGQAPPPLSLVACVRMDLLTSSSFSDCIFYSKVPASTEGAQRSSSIWRIENAFGSFMAQMDVAQPSPSVAYDLREFLRYSNLPSNAAALPASQEEKPGLKTPSGSSRRLDLQNSGRGKLESMTSKTGKYYSTVAHFERMWWDKGSDAKKHVSIWRPVLSTGYAMLGDYATDGYEPPVGGLVMRDDGTGRLARPLGFKARAHLVGRNIEEASLWLPVAPPGYVALGCVAARGFNPPDPDCVRCVRMDLVNQAHFQSRPVWESAGKAGKGASACSFWRVENAAGTFMVRSDLKPPPWRMAFGLAELGKPKLPENLALELKTGRISVTAFDDFSGLLNPLADVSISGTNLLAHGRLELLNAVMITSVAASTFNSALDAWEPLVEPWEGLLKWEANNDPSEQALPAGSRLRIAASSVLNVNLNSAGIEMLVGAQLAWKRNAELEEEARKELQLALSDDDDLTDGPVAVEGSSALDQDDFARVTMENKLGTPIFVAAGDPQVQAVQRLPAGECAVVRLPPPRFPELYTAGFTRQDETRAPRQFMAVRLVEGEALPSGARVCDLEYMACLRVLTSQPGRKVRDSRVLPQSARTRSVAPSSGEDGRLLVRWEEVFLFELPPGSQSEVEVTVFSQAANAGRGEPVGAALLPMSDAEEVRANQWTLVREHLDARRGLHWPDVETRRIPLLVVGDHERTPAGGHVAVAAAFFKYGAVGDEGDADAQRSVQLGLSAEGPWTGLRSVLALATYPERLGEAPFAVDVVLKAGLKFVELRSLVVLANELDSPLEVAICPRALLDQADAAADSPADGLATVVEEQFENQRYQPIRGWGSKWPGNFVLGDPARWSNRDSSQSSQDFTAVPLPPGWEWTSEWHVDKVGYVDLEGWAYNMDFKSLRWPPPTVKARKKGPFDFVRRRRWIRTRRRVSDEGGGTRVGVGVVPSGGTLPLPWSSVQPGSDYCVQVRPRTAGTSSLAWHSWGRPVQKAEPPPAEDSPHASSSSGGSGQLLRGISGGLARLGSGHVLSNKDGVPANVFQLRSLSKTEELLLCNPLQRSGEAPRGPAWLSMEADAAVLYSEINNPVYDWRLTVAAPLSLSNLLPVRAEYQVWEKPKRTAPVLRQRGVVESGGSVQVCAVDVRRPLFLSWWPQGAWKPERDLVLISDPTRMEAELPASFWVAHTRSSRRLRISVEHDLGDSDVSAKRVRLYVPYWLKNEAKVPLAYRLSEIEDTGRAAKKAGPGRLVRGSSGALQRVVKGLEDIEDQHGTPVMLSLPHSDKVGLAVSLAANSVFSTAIPFKAFEDQLDRIDLNAVDASGVYCKLSASIEMSSYGYERTKVVRLQPHTVFTNRLGQALYIKQHGTPQEDVLGPADVAKALLWRSIYQQELVQVRTDSSRWSQPFSLAAEGMMHITLRGVVDNARQMIRAEIRNGVADSRFAVVFRACSAHGPHKVENRSLVLPIRFRQKGSDDSSWSVLSPGSSASFNWEDLLRERMVEVLVDGADPASARFYGLDTPAEYPPLASTRGPVAALHTSVYREGAAMVLRVEDWKPSTGDLAIVSRTPSFAGVGASSSAADAAGASSREAGAPGGETEFHMLLDLHDLGVSLIDHTPEELVFVAIQGASISYSTGLAGGVTRFEVHIAALQVDNQLALTPMPVLMALEDSPTGVRPESVLKLTVSMRASADHVQNYPYIGVQFTENAWLLNVHEPLIWRLVEMVARLRLGRLLEEASTAVTVDPRVHIGLLNLTDLRFKLTLAIAPAQRPRGILGFWTTLVTSIGNTNEMQLNFQGRVREDIHMRHSQLVDSMARGVRNDLLGQPFHLLTGLDILGNLSSVVGTLSKGAAALSMDKKFIRSRQRQETKAGVEDLGDGLREGGEAFAKGLFRGVTGILTKPVEGFKASGLEGFASGVARGVIGAAAQPMSGVLDLVSKTTDGFNAQGRKISAAITAEQALQRTRLPRAIGGDSIVRPYDEYRARGQMIMQLAERGTYFGQYDIFKERAKFATSDAYEDHFNLPKNRTLVITHRRVLMLQHPSSLTGKRPDLMKEACSITWHVAWEDLMTLELLHSKHDPPGAPHSRVVVHLRAWSQDARLFDTKEIARVVKCHPGTQEAAKIREAIQHAYDTYGPDRATIAQLTSHRRSARKPYAGTGTGAVSGAALGLLAGPAAPIAVPIMATFGAIVGGAGQAILQADAAQVDDKHAASAQGQQSALGYGRSGSSAGGQHRRQRSSQELPRPASAAELPRAACRLVRQFRLMWWDKGAAWSKNYPVSIWRPIAPPGYVVLGDLVQCGYEAPPMAMVYAEDTNGHFAQPEGYDLVWRDTDSGAREPVTIWRPRAPPGYAALGCVAVPDYYEPDRSIVRCVRADCTTPARLGDEPTWRDHKGAALWQCSLWQVDNQARTFLARRDHQRPNGDSALAVRIAEATQV